MLNNKHYVNLGYLYTGSPRRKILPGEHISGTVPRLFIFGCAERTGRKAGVAGVNDRARAGWSPPYKPTPPTINDSYPPKIENTHKKGVKKIAKNFTKRAY